MIRICFIISLFFKILVHVSAALDRRGAVVGYTLVDTVNMRVIVQMHHGQVIDLADADTQLSILADVEGNVTNVTMSLTYEDERLTTVERSSPFALGGKYLEGKYNPVASLSIPGKYEISATPLWIQSSGEVLFGETFSLKFEVIRSEEEKILPVSHNTFPERLVKLLASAEIERYLDENSTAPPTTSPPETNITLTDVPAYAAAINGTVSGELRKWHKVTIGFLGPYLTESDVDTNPFLDLRLTVTFEHQDTLTVYSVPGYFAADGNAANTGASEGEVWLVHFVPDRVGIWTWSASFVVGPNIAVEMYDVGVSAGYFDNTTGWFEVTESLASGRDLRRLGRLEYVGAHYYQFGEGEWFLKAGADSPENLLAYEDFDNTPNIGGRRKAWAPHVQDYKVDDPTWANGKGKGIIGAINYLSDMGMNAFSFLTLNIQGDDQNVFPYVSDQTGDRVRFDVSKLAQWEVVFEHADHVGMYMHFKTQETENDQLLDGGELGTQRKLYYRELIARFSHHLALSWSLGEENTNTVAQRKAFVGYFGALDPYNHPIDMHTFAKTKAIDYTGMLGLAGFSGASLQSALNKVHAETLEWRTKSASANQKWVVTNDEQNPQSTGVVPDAVDPAHNTVRKSVLWGNLMAGGGGVEYYFGYNYANSDLSCEDFRSRQIMWQQTSYALQFFTTHVPFWRMTPSDECVSVVNLPANKTYSIQWFDPRVGGALKLGTVKTVSGGVGRSVGQAPNNRNKDWAALLHAVARRELEVSSDLPPVEALGDIQPIDIGITEPPPESKQRLRARRQG